MEESGALSLARRKGNFAFEIRYTVSLIDSLIKRPSPLAGQRRRVSLKVPESTVYCTTVTVERWNSGGQIAAVTIDAILHSKIIANWTGSVVCLRD